MLEVYNGESINSLKEVCFVCFRVVQSWARHGNLAQPIHPSILPTDLQLSERGPTAFGRDEIIAIVLYILAVNLALTDDDITVKVCVPGHDSIDTVMTRVIGRYLETNWTYSARPERDRTEARGSP